MDYEKMYKAALKTATYWIKEGCIDKEKICLECVFPELRESEDERMRKRIINILGNNTDAHEEGWVVYADEIAYLKKQKEQPTDTKSERVIKAARSVLNNWLDGTDCPDVSGDFTELEYAIREYDGEEKQKDSKVCEEKSKNFTIQKEQKPNIELIRRSWYMEGYHDREFGKEPKWIIKTGEGGPRHEPNPRYGQPLAKEQNPAEWKPQPESLEALMYAIEGKWNMIPPTSYLSRRLEDLYEGLVNTFNVNETLLAELPKTAYTAEDIEELRELKHKIEASMEQKPAEWSEEAEMYLSQAIETLEHENHLILADKLKSLRPSWGPSEDEERLINTSISFLKDFADKGYENAVECIDWLKSKLNGNTCK